MHAVGYRNWGAARRGRAAAWSPVASVEISLALFRVLSDQLHDASDRVGKPSPGFEAAGQIFRRSPLCQWLFVAHRHLHAIPNGCTRRVHQYSSSEHLGGFLQRRLFSNESRLQRLLVVYSSAGPSACAVGQQGGGEESDDTDFE